MKSTIGQKYAPTLFFGGLAADIDSELLDPKTGTVLEAQYMHICCLLYTSPSPRDATLSRMPSSA